MTTPVCVSLVFLVVMSTSQPFLVCTARNVSLNKSINSTLRLKSSNIPKPDVKYSRCVFVHASKSKQLLKATILTPDILFNSCRLPYFKKPSLVLKVCENYTAAWKKGTIIIICVIFVSCCKKSKNFLCREPPDMQVDWTLFAVGIVEPVCCLYSGCVSPLAVTLYSHCSHWFLRSASWRRVLRGSPA